MTIWQAMQPTVVAFLGLPGWETFKPFIVTGLALGGVYALSGVGMVVLYRTTGVLNLAFGAVGAFGALVAWELVNNHGWSQWPAFAVCILIGGAITLAYGVIFGPPLAGRDPLVNSVAAVSVGVIDGFVTRRRRGLRPQTQTGTSGGQTQPRRSAWKNRLTIRSSSE